MVQPRLRGQETFVTMLEGGRPVARIDSISDFEITEDNEVQTEDYLGETSSRYDTIHNGASFRMTIHLTNKDAFRIDGAIRDKAKRRSGSTTRFDITNTMFFANGDVVTQTLADVQFGAIPTNVGSRKDFVSKTYEGNSSEIDIV